MDFYLLAIVAYLGLGAVLFGETLDLVQWTLKVSRTRAIIITVLLVPVVPVGYGRMFLVYWIRGKT